MGVINQGILGGVSGRVGNVIGSSWKGIPYIRIMPASVANPQTPAQQAQRQKMSLVLKFLQGVKNAALIGFKDFSVKMSAFNAAMSYNLRNGVTGAYPAQTLDFAKLSIGRGPLDPGADFACASGSPGVISVTWSVDPTSLTGLDTDKIMIAAYNETTQEGVSDTEAAVRVNETASLTVPSSRSGDTVYVYAGFYDSARDLESNSVLVGSVVVA